MTYREAIVIDGLEVCKWEPDVFAAMRDAGVTAANCTVAIEDDFYATMRKIAQFKRWFSECADVVIPVKTTSDIHTAKREGKVGIILGFQSTRPLDDNYLLLPILKDVGVGVCQLTYNTQNSVGSGCFESVDRGLSDFGREVVKQMNAAGIVVDIAHAGPQTSRDAIEVSEKPVVCSHAAPHALHAFERNISDDLIRLVSECGGVIGVPMLPWHLGTGETASIDDYLDALEYMISVGGEEHVGIGSDCTQGQGAWLFDDALRDKGYARLLIEPDRIEAWQNLPPLNGFAGLEDFPNLGAEMQRRAWGEDKMRKVLGMNWLRVFEQAWAA